MKLRDILAAADAAILEQRDHAGTAAKRAGVSPMAVQVALDMLEAMVATLRADLHGLRDTNIADIAPVPVIAPAKKAAKKVKKAAKRDTGKL